MPFPDSVKAAALARSGGRCECLRKEHKGHPTGRCATEITSANSEYRYKTAEQSGGNDSLFNCEALCVSCYEQAMLLVRHPSPLDRSP